VTSSLGKEELHNICVLFHRNVGLYTSFVFHVSTCDLYPHVAFAAYDTSAVYTIRFPVV
jgi:hypothetical protein